MIHVDPTALPSGYTVTFPGRGPIKVSDDGQGSRPEWVRLLELAASTFTNTGTIRTVNFGEASRYLQA